MTTGEKAHLIYNEFPSAAQGLGQRFSVPDEELVQLILERNKLKGIAPPPALIEELPASARLGVAAVGA